MSAPSEVFTAFQGGQGAALAVVVGFALLSFIAVDFVWLRILAVGVNQLLGKGSLQTIKRERAIFHSQLGTYMVSLLLSNLLSSLSFMMNITWVSQKGIMPGNLCTSQAALSQVADVAGAYFTGAIAVHTFTSLVLKFRLPLWFVLSTVVCGWAASIVMAVFPMHSQTKLGPFYTVNGLMCSINAEYPQFETVIHLVPIFAASLIAAIFYSLVFLILRGTVVFRGGLKLNLDYESRRTTMYDSHEYPRFIAAIARSMLWYPIAYVVLMFPHLITCLLRASGFKVSDVWSIVTAAAAAILGLANVLIFYNTIRIMGPAFDGKTSQSSSEKFAADKTFFSGNDSPVDVAPPVATLRALPRAFPAPRGAASMSSSEYSHSRQASSISTISGDSTRALLPAAHVKNARSGYPSRNDIGRPITPVAELNEMISSESPRPTLAVKVPAENLSSLPAPRRETRSPNTYHPASMSPVPLSGNKTPSSLSPESAYPSQRNSFINMYASSNEAVPAMPSFKFSTSPGYSSHSPSDGEESDVPRSAFSSKMPVPAAIPRVRAAKPKSLKSEMLDRMSMVESPEESNGGLSAIAWASLVANAATSNGGAQSASTSSFSYSDEEEERVPVKSVRRRSSSMGSLRVTAPLAIPSTLRPGFRASRDRPSAPVSARLPSNRGSGASRPLPAPMPRSAGVRGYENGERRMRMREGPSRTPTYRSSEDA